MGWNRGNEIFDPVARVLLDSPVVGVGRARVLRALIEALQGADWDTEDESLETFKNYPEVVEAFRRYGITLDEEEGG